MAEGDEFTTVRREQQLRDEGLMATGFDDQARGVLEGLDYRGRCCCGIGLGSSRRQIIAQDHNH
jgi:hypothetical protein